MPSISIPTHSPQMSGHDLKYPLSASDWKKLLAIKNPMPEWVDIQAFLATDEATPVKAVPVARLAWWAQRVTRFSFLVEPSALEWLERTGQGADPALATAPPHAEN